MKSQTIILLFLSVLLTGCQSGKALNSSLGIERGTYHPVEKGGERKHYTRVRADYGPIREDGGGSSVCGKRCQDFYILRLFWEVGVGNTKYKKYERIFNIKSLLEEQDIYSKLRHDIYLAEIIPRIFVDIEDDAISIVIEVQGKHGSTLERHDLYYERL